MKIKAGAIAGILVLSVPLPLFGASATKTPDPTSLRFRDAGNQEVNTAIEKPRTLLSSLKVPALEEESR